jgi:tetratricopeptide (TPR) repeat protein
MSRTLNFMDRLLARGETSIRQGRDHDALGILHRLVCFQQLPLDTAIEAQVQLAEIHQRRGEYRKARRHLQIALAGKPACARYHYLMANIHDEDENGDPGRALYHYRRACNLEPKDPTYHCDYGLCLISLDRTEQGLRHLQQAVALAPENPRFVRHLALALLDNAQPNQARRAVLMARFRNPRDRQLQKLWEDLCFWEAERAQHEQHAEQLKVAGSGPSILPLIRGEPTRRAAHSPDSASVIRMDKGAPFRGPHRPDSLARQQGHS